MNVQQLNIELIRKASFNDFDGDRVADDLIANMPLWDGALMTRLGSLICLRDLACNPPYWNVDTLHVLSSGENDEALCTLAESWGPDEIDWVCPDDAARMLGAYPAPARLLRVWWD